MCIIALVLNDYVHDCVGFGRHVCMYKKLLLKSRLRACSRSRLRACYSAYGRFARQRPCENILWKLCFIIARSGTSRLPPRLNTGPDAKLMSFKLLPDWEPGQIAKLHPPSYCQIAFDHPIFVSHSYLNIWFVSRYFTSPSEGRSIAWSFGRSMRGDQFN